MKRLLVLTLLLTACSTTQVNAVPTADLKATVQAAIDATQSVKPTATSIPPTSTPAPPTYTPYPTYTPLPTYTPYPTYTPVNTEAPSPTSTPTPNNIAVPKLTTVPSQGSTSVSTPVTPATPALTATIVANGFSPMIMKMGYDYWGRPMSMEDPSKYNDCYIYDNKSQLLRFLISLSITNNTNQTWKSGSRSFKVYKTGGERAFTTIWAESHILIHHQVSHTR
jgi:hypothetical protein